MAPVRRIGAINVSYVELHLAVFILFELNSLVRLHPVIWEG